MHVCGLVAELAVRLEHLGCVTSPGARHRRHILTFSHPDVAGERLEEGLAEAGVVVSLRRGRIRVSPHLYNTSAEMERVADAVRALLLRSMTTGIAALTSPPPPGRLSPQAVGVFHFRTFWYTLLHTLLGVLGLRAREHRNERGS